MSYLPDLPATGPRRWSRGPLAGWFEDALRARLTPLEVEWLMLRLTYQFDLWATAQKLRGQALDLAKAAEHLLDLLRQERVAHGMLITDLQSVQFAVRRALAAWEGDEARAPLPE